MEYNITTEVATDDVAMPAGTVSRAGQWTEAVAAAAEDGKVRITRGLPEDKDIQDRIRRQLSHTAASLRTAKYPEGAGTATKVVVEDGKPTLYWQVRAKRVKSPSSGTSTPAGGGTGSNGSGAPSTRGAKANA